MAVSIQIAGQAVSRLEGESHSIGSDSGCAIRIAGDGVAPRHALLRRVAGRWLLEAAGDHLIRVGDGRPTRLAWLNPGDEIFISDDGPPLVFEPAAPNACLKSAANPVGKPAGGAGSLPVTRNSESPSARTDGQRQPMWFAVGGAGLLASGILLTFLILKLSGAFRGGPTENVDSGSRPPRESNEAPTAKQGSQEVSPVTMAGEKTPAPSAAGELFDALYLVQVVADGNQQVYRLGTAWAIAPRRLITSGAVAAGLQSLHDVAPLARVASATGKQTLTIRSFKLHPAYEAAIKEGADAQGEAEGFRLELERSAADVDSLSERLIAAEERRFQAFERQTGVDLAWLEVEGDLTGMLPVANADENPIKVGNRLRLVGFPFPADDFIVDPDHPPAVSSIDATVGTAPGRGGAARSYWRIRTASDLGLDNWSGGPVVDATGRVVGIYSRPTPPPPGRAPPETWIMHDVTDVDGLSAFGESWK